MFLQNLIQAVATVKSVCLNTTCELYSASVILLHYFRFHQVNGKSVSKEETSCLISSNKTKCLKRWIKYTGKLKQKPSQKYPKLLAMFSTHFIRGGSPCRSLVQLLKKNAETKQIKNNSIDFKLISSLLKVPRWKRNNNG